MKSFEKEAEEKRKIFRPSVENMIIGKVCSSCGGTLSCIDTVDNSGSPTVWSGCNDCQKYDWGVSRESFELARSLITETKYKPYTYSDEIRCEPTDQKEKEYWLRTQTGGAYEMVNFIQKKITQSFKDGEARGVGRVIEMIETKGTASQGYLSMIHPELLKAIGNLKAGEE